MRFAFALAAVALAAAAPARAADPLVFISSFEPGDKGAIHAYTFDPTAGALKPLAHTGGVEHPFYLALAPDHKTLYSIHAKAFGGKENEHVAAFRLDGRTGKLSLLNRVSSEGTASCYLDVDRTGKAVLVANYTSGSVASLPVKADGSLGDKAAFFQHKGASVNPQRQKEPHAHCIVVSPDNKYAYAADLGTDQVLCYRLDPATAKLTPNDPPFAKSPPGAGPRHLTFAPDGKTVYVVNELLNSVTVFDYAAGTGTLAEKQTISTLPADFKGTSHCADVKATRDGKFVYATNRGHDSIAVYKTGGDGKLELVAVEPSLGKGPQNLALTPDGGHLLCANMPGGNVVVFRINPQTGRLTPHGEPVRQASPSCVAIVP